MIQSEVIFKTKAGHCRLSGNDREVVFYGACTVDELPKLVEDFLAPSVMALEHNIREQKQRVQSDGASPPA